MTSARLFRAGAVPRDVPYRHAGEKAAFSANRNRSRVRVLSNGRFDRPTDHG
ncbi:hypothetical protein HMPREF9622_00409 [Cutibacterium modestum HL037PA3]|nr:hypothetical protein HMPREF9622_00409 [Cutibacterium modestum HL037PA3]